MTKSTEVDKNFAAFQRMLPELLKTHPGKYALMHDKEVVEFFDTFGDAARFGKEKFGEIFSIQEVTNRGVSLGIFASYAMHHLSS